MGERGQVIDVKDNNVIVRLTRTEACAKCRACIAGLSTEEMIVTAKNNCGARAYDWVIIELENSDFLSAVYIMYGIPLVMLMLGFFTGFYAARLASITYDAPIGFGVGIVFMWLGFEWIRKREDHWKSRGFIPVASELADQESIA